MTARKSTHKAETKASHPGKSGAAQAPWDKDPPKGASHAPLSPQAKAAARRRAKEAGRPYPNLVDNMHAAQASKK